MKSPDPDHELPFLELNEEIPAEWSVEARPEQPSVTPSTVDATQTRPSVFQEPVPPRRQTSVFVLTPAGKLLLYTTLGFILLLVLFRVPPGLLLMGVFSVFRVLFLPLAILGFFWFVWQRRR